MTYGVANYTLIAWEPLTFSVLLSLALAVFFAVRRRRGEEALRVPDRRYVNGEITREEYLNIRDDITRNGDA